jgi:16S rRNA (adenine1518-N6/adenine1519-N6)-dimethyltransferase
MANKLLGQHFLKNEAVLKNIIDALQPTAGDKIVEIGPGNGELTAPLAERCANIGCEILAIEKDAALADGLIQRKKWSNVRIVKGDALALLTELPETQKNKYKIVGNIPYYLTGHLLRVISELGNRPERCVLMVQKEVAERIIARPPKMNRLAASVQFWAIPEIAEVVSRDNFIPKPKVDSAIVVFNAKSEKIPVEAEHYYATVRALFAQPRKTILNNLSAAYGEQKEKDKISRGLQNIGVNPGARPQDLSIQSIMGITQWLDSVVAV